jgi:hypothetical protein
LVFLQETIGFNQEGFHEEGFDGESVGAADQKICAASRWALERRLAIFVDPDPRSTCIQVEST